MNETLWEYVALADRDRPEEPTSDKLRTGLASLWERFRPWSGQAPALGKDNLDAPPERVLDEVVPRPDFTAAAEALGVAVEERLRENTSLLVVFEPGDATRAAFGLVAENRGWCRADPPTRDAIRTGARDWAAALPQETAMPLVLPALERCYLRHHRGLEPVRRLFDRISRGEGPWIVGCDSWAWAYLRWALGAEALFPATLALRGFDGERLCHWLAQLARGTDWVFRDAESGAPLLRAGAESGAPADPEEEAQTFFTTLAGRSQGVPGVARAIWRYALSVEVTDAAKKEAEQESPAELGQTLWVAPWSKLSLPTVPAGSSQTDTFVLHTLLLHGGLEEDILEALVPPSGGERSLVALHRLRRERLISKSDTTWRVDPLAYPAVSRHVADYFGLGDGL